MFQERNSGTDQWINTCRKRVCLCLALFVFCAALFAVFFKAMPYRKGIVFLHALKSDSFTLEGDLVSWNSAKVVRNHVKEYRNEATYGIEYLKRSYYVNGDQLYITNNDDKWVSVPMSDEGTADQLTRASVISNYDFSVVEFCGGYEAEIPELSSGDPILCDCEMYRAGAGEQYIYLYFTDDTLYAIQTNSGNPNLHRFFYLSNFSNQTML